MARPYVITEGKLDAEILQRLLPATIAQNVIFVDGGGKYGAKSMASTLLVTRQRPVALVIDADTLDPAVLQEQQDSARALLRQVSPGVPFEVFLAKPEIEEVFFQDQALVERILQTTFTPREWEYIQYDPKKLLAENSMPVQAILDQLSEADIQLLREHSLIKEIGQFLASVVAVDLTPKP